MRSTPASPLVARIGTLVVSGVLGTVVLLGCSSDDEPAPPPEVRPPAEGTANDAVATFPEPATDLDTEPGEE